MRGRRFLVALAALAAAASVQARRAAIQCESTADCAEGETCVAGDSVSAIQRCVSGAACGGAAYGSCPSDDDSGQLACIWREGCASSSDGCATVSGVLGIYKCLSIARCDDYFGGSACSAGCTSSSGEQCNGKGSCQLDANSSASTPSFSCACDSGYSGSTCESGSDDSSGSLSSSLSSSSSSSSLMTSLNASDSASRSTDASGGSTSASLSVDESSSASRDASAGSGAANNVAGSAQSDDNQITSGSSSGGSGSTIVIIVAVIAAVVLVGAIMFAVYARKKRKQKDEEGDDGFSRADTGSDPDALAAGGADTPKNNIVTM